MTLATISNGRAPASVAPGEHTQGLEFNVVPGRQVSPEEISVWSEIQRSDPVFESPFFRPEYTQAVAAVRDDVWVAVASRQDEPLAFFPFQRRRWSRGLPVGGPLTAYEGIITRPGIIIDPKALLRACGLVSWPFHHLIGTQQQQFACYCHRACTSLCVDLSGGLPAYLSWRHEAHRKFFSEWARRARKIEREVGPLRLEVNSQDAGILTKLMEWKSDQFRAKKVPNKYGYPWARQLIDRLLNSSQDGLSASLTALYAKDELLAMGLLLRSGDVMFPWEISYSTQYAKYSPGMILLMRFVDALPAMGVRCLDFGLASESYKWKLCNRAAPILQGAVDLRPWTRFCRKTWIQVRERVRASRFHQVLRTPWTWLRLLRGWADYR